MDYETQFIYTALRFRWFIYILNSRIGHRVYPEQVMDQIISHEAFTFSLGLYN